VRRSEKQITDPGEINTIMAKGEVCRLGLTADNIPYIVPVNFAHKKNILYFHSAHVGRKIDMLKRNPVVAFEVSSEYSIVQGDNACGWGCSYRCVMGIGRAVFVTDSEEKAKALSLIMDKYSGRNNWSFDNSVLDRTTVVRVDIGEMTGKQS
jgi:uncharacterized protein